MSQQKLKSILRSAKLRPNDRTWLARRVDEYRRFFGVTIGRLKSLGETQVTEFLTDLAVDRNVSWHLLMPPKGGHRLDAAGLPCGRSR